jgi:hypothetical protein
MRHMRRKVHGTNGFSIDKISLARSTSEPAMFSLFIARAPHIEVGSCENPFFMRTGGWMLWRLDAGAR